MSKQFYTPEEAASRLGISVRMLGYYRRTGRIQGTNLGNTTVFTEEQLASADLTKQKPGPKRSKAKREDDEPVPVSA